MQRNCASRAKWTRNFCTLTVVLCDLPQRVRRTLFRFGRGGAGDVRCALPHGLVYRVGVYADARVASAAHGAVLPRQPSRAFRLRIDGRRTHRADRASADALGRGGGFYGAAGRILDRACLHRDALYYRGMGGQKDLCPPVRTADVERNLCKNACGNCGQPLVFFARIW